MSDMPDGSYDLIVVGGGSAGCVLAHRLSEDPGRRILLIEAGIDMQPGREPAAVLDSFPGRAYFDPAYTWTDLRVRLHPHSDNLPAEQRPPLRRYEQGRVIGGGSSINGQMAIRGSPHDFEGWVRAGAAGWGWADVLPYFKRLERDMDFDDSAWHGRAGRFPIRRTFEPNWCGFSRAAAQAYEAAGHVRRLDMNGAWEDGFFPAPFANAYDRRVSAAIAYLDAATRRRANLAIMCNAHVPRILMEGRRAIGVEVVMGGESAPRTVRAGHVIVAAGALQSPALLMRSGIGPAAHLRSLGLPVAVERAGVGRNLAEHPMLAITAYLTAEARLKAPIQRHIQVNLRYSSGHPGTPQGDMFINCISRSAWHALGGRLGTLQVWANRSYSRGFVRLAAPDWRTPPEVCFNLLQDPRDLVRMTDGFRRLAGFFDHPALKAVTRAAFPSSYSERVRDVNKVTAINAVLTSILARVMDGPDVLRTTLVRNLITQGITLKDVLATDDALEAYARKTVTGIWHASCTCRMGAPDDPLAVTDPRARVIGTEALRVADSSIMPDVPCANTNVTTMMIAEKVADAIGTDSKVPA